MDLNEIQTVVAVFAMIIGGAGAIFGPLVGYYVAHRRMQLRKKSAVRRQKSKADEIRIATQRVDIAHYETVINGYKDLLQQRQASLEWVHVEVKELRDLVNTLRSDHASEVQALRNQVAAGIEEKISLRCKIEKLETEAIEMRGRLHALELSSPHPSASIEIPNV